MYASTQCTNGDCRVAASFSPHLFAVWPVALALLLAFKSPPLKVSETRTVKKRYIFAAWFIDYLLLMLALGPIVAVSALAAESAHQGYWVSAFDRDYLRATDSVATVSILAMFPAIAVYFGRSANGETVTVGQYLMRFRIRADASRAAWRQTAAIMFLPAAMIARPIEARIGIRRSPAFVFAQIEVDPIE
ncbi:hypothetical protein [Maricaulis sp.]|uniref:hypothetical protein n=1 Tax=Maricaulis sp. TaxID=1486257 RepID=UPI003A94E017